MLFEKTQLEGVILLKPDAYADHRGSFLESYNSRLWLAQQLPTEFVQDNQSISKKGVIRGLHFQRPPFEQGKLVRVAHGKALDVVVDIRNGSKTFGRHISVLLDATENNMLWIPPGFAHGFEALEDDTVFLYKVTDYYHPEAEGGFRFDDPAIGINWSSSNPIVSQKDLLLPTFKEWMSSL